MNNNTKALFQLSPAPMLAVEQGRIVMANSRADELFGKTITGCTAVGIVPDHILVNTSESFVSTAVIGNGAYCVSAARSGDRLFLSFAPDRGGAPGPEFVSDSLLNSMLSSLFNIGLAIDRLSAVTTEGDNPKLDDYLAMLNHSYHNMRHSVVNLSSSISLRRGCLPFSFRATNLAKLCSDIVSTVSVICSGKGVELEFSTALGELYALADSEKVERIILNLLSNSLTHTPRGGKISIGLEKSGDKAYISVTDNGSGIPAAEMAELFTKYDRESRAPNLASLSSGGLGLGVARGLAEGHGGALIIESREGKGTSVRVMLPLRSSELSTLESDSIDYVNSGMSLILTELAPILDSSSYTRKYTE